MCSLSPSYSSMIWASSDGAERRRDQGLGLAAGEERRAVGAGEEADLAGDRPDLVEARGRRSGCAVEHRLARQDLPEVVGDRLGDLLALGPRSSGTMRDRGLLDGLDLGVARRSCSSASGRAIIGASPRRGGPRRRALAGYASGACQDGFGSPPRRWSSSWAPTILLDRPRGRRGSRRSASARRPGGRRPRPSTTASSVPHDDQVEVRTCRARRWSGSG